MLYSLVDILRNILYRFFNILRTINVFSTVDMSRTNINFSPIDPRKKLKSVITKPTPAINAITAAAIAAAAITNPTVTGGVTSDTFMNAGRSPSIDASETRNFSRSMVGTPNTSVDNVNANESLPKNLKGDEIYSTDEEEFEENEKEKELEEGEEGAERMVVNDESLQDSSLGIDIPPPVPSSSKNKEIGANGGATKRKKIYQEKTKKTDVALEKKNLISIGDDRCPTCAYYVKVVKNLLKTIDSIIHV